MQYNDRNRAPTKSDQSIENMFPSATISHSNSISEEASVSTDVDFAAALGPLLSPTPSAKKKRNQPGNPDPDAEVVALSPGTLLTTNRFVCELCNKGFQRDQNLQLHRRGHNLPWRLRQRTGNEPVKKRVYVCPEPSCVHHHPSRALGDLTGIKKHFSRKHGEKKWKCDKCSKKYAVHSDWKAHVKSCGSKDYLCDCGTLFSRKDSFITHRAFCDALAEESVRLITSSNPNSTATTPLQQPHFNYLSTTWHPTSNPNPKPNSFLFPNPNPNINNSTNSFHPYLFSNHFPSASLHSSATALLQIASSMRHLPPAMNCDQLTRDFLGGVPTGEELLPLRDHGLDAVTSSTCVMGGDHTKTLPGFGSPPATGAWDDF